MMDSNSERRMLPRLIRRRFGKAIADQSALMLERIERPAMFEDVGEELFNCVDAASLAGAAERGGWESLPLNHACQTSRQAPHPR